MAMIRHRAARGSRVPTRLLYSSRSLEDVIYKEELDRFVGQADGLDVIHILTRSQPPGWSGYSRRIDRDMLAELGYRAEQRPLCMVCGPTPLVEVVASMLVELGNPPDRVKTERFGPTGG
jgi:ferredoxin-NADP reductase